MAGNAFEKTHAPKYRWFSVLVLVGAILGITLLTQAFRNYYYVSNWMVQDQARSEADRFVTLLERELRTAQVQSDADINKVTDELFRENGASIQYLRIFELPSNNIVAEEGTAPVPGFTEKQLTEVSRDFESAGLSELRRTPAGQVLLRVARLRLFGGPPPQPRGGVPPAVSATPPAGVPPTATAVLPALPPPVSAGGATPKAGEDSSQKAAVPVPPLTMTPGEPPQRGGREGFRGGRGNGPGRRRMVEVAVLLDRDASVLSPLRRNLIISCTAAIALLGSMALLGLRFRNYVTGKQLEEQLALARRVQQDLLPSVEQLGTADISARCVPAWQVGGDFYDVFPAGDGKMALVLGDVSGKGIPASLLMGLLHGAVRMSRWVGSAEEHEESSRLLNHLLCVRTSQERYACMFWSYYDPSTHILRYINAGHLPPLLVSKNDKGEFSAKRLEEGGPVLGLVEYAGFQQAQVEVGAGDLLILYSDGVGEAMNAAGEEFGEERLIASIREKWDSQAGDIRDNILVRVAAFLNGLEPHDDQTLMVARLRNAQGEHQWQIAEDAKPEKVLAGS